MRVERDLECADVFIVGHTKRLPESFLANRLLVTFLIYRLNSDACTRTLRPVAPKKRIELDEIALATRLATGETMRECALELGVTGPVVKRRVDAWRLEIAAGMESLPLRVLYWRDDASYTRVARRWLFIRTRDSRWEPTEIEITAEKRREIIASE